MTPSLELVAKCLGRASANCLMIATKGSASHKVQEKVLQRIIGITKKEIDNKSPESWEELRRVMKIGLEECLKIMEEYSDTSKN